jgi:hypothetical protein
LEGLRYGTTADPAMYGLAGCKEEKKRVSEFDYKVDLGDQSTFQKRRKSMEVGPLLHPGSFSYTTLIWYPCLSIPAQTNASSARAAFSQHDGCVGREGEETIATICS